MIITFVKFLACRDEEKGRAAVNQIIYSILEKSKTRSFQNITIEFMQLDLSSFKSIHNFVEQFKAKNLPLHYLICNAGVMNIAKGKTEEGFELHFGVNHLGHFLLTNLLLDILKSSAPAKIINVSSDAHYMGISSLQH